jgi:hypothetical protein
VSDMKPFVFNVHAHLTTEAHTCISSLKSDDDTVDLRGLTGKEKSVRKDENSKRYPLCLCSKTLCQGSCNDYVESPHLVLLSMVPMCYEYRRTLTIL